jgi:hypothetical protein
MTATLGFGVLFWEARRVGTCEKNTSAFTLRTTQRHDIIASQQNVFPCLPTNLTVRSIWVVRMQGYELWTLDLANGG